ncbi:MAG: AAA family ATPase [Nitrospirota bacterium]
MTGPVATQLSQDIREELPVTEAVKAPLPLFTALAHLDDLLAIAIARAQANYGASAQDPFRGLHIGLDEINRLLGREPGAPTLTTSVEAMLAAAMKDVRFAWLCRTYSLSNMQAATILITIAPDIDLRYERMYAYLQDDVSKKRPTVDLVLNMLCATVQEKVACRFEFGPDGPLVKHRLIQIAHEPHQSLLACPLQVDAQIIRLVLEGSGLDSRLQPYCQLRHPIITFDDIMLPPATKQALKTMVADARRAQRPLPLYLQGLPGSGQEQVAEALATHLGVVLLTANIEGARHHSLGFGEALRLIFREAWLEDAVLYCSGIDALQSEDKGDEWPTFLNALAKDGGRTVLAGQKPWNSQGASPTGVITIDCHCPSVTERRECWDREITQAGGSFDETDAAKLAERFRLTPPQIQEAVASAGNQVRWRAALTPQGGHSQSPILTELFTAARAQCGYDLTHLARRITPRYTWPDIVLSADAKAQLHELCHTVAHRHRVLSEWGFGQKLSLGKGVNALFAGPSGTGKTMAAEVVANELGLDLYKIDLSCVVSKYIGETEKNLDKIFRAAQNSNGILFFDEADALFGKRSEVRDSHDRYANLEISYLLQKMEEYEGMAILTTNLRQNMDDACVRRLAFTIHFPFPDEYQRKEIWTRVWPGSVPLASDVDAQFLSNQFKLSGGNIKNIALASAFLAAADGGVVTMDHLRHATQREYQKLGKVLSRSELYGASNGAHV